MDYAGLINDLGHMVVRALTAPYDGRLVEEDEVRATAFAVAAATFREELLERLT